MRSKPTVASLSEARVLLADAQEATRRGARLALEENGLTVCAEARDADEAVALAASEHPDICLIDTALPGDGIAAAVRIGTEAPSSLVVMIAESADEEEFLDALRAGAAGYLLKEMNVDRLHHALLGVLAGEAAIPRRLVSRMAQEISGRGRRRVFLLRRRGIELTGREWQTLSLLVDGLSTAEMAGRLRISEVTVRRHISRLLAKLDVPDRHAARALLEELDDVQRIEQ